jgi:hypothetical protein
MIKDNVFVIGIAGIKYHGKSAFGKALLHELSTNDDLNVVVIPYAYKLKKFLIDFVSEATKMPEDRVKLYFYDSIYKEQKIPNMFGVTSRTLMTKFGTEFARDCISNEFWIHSLNQEIFDSTMQSSKPLVVIVDDVRFEDELQNILSYHNHKMIYVKRNIKINLFKKIWNKVFIHKSERGVNHLYRKGDKSQIMISNDSSLEVLQKEAKIVYNNIIGEINESIKKCDW